MSDAVGLIMAILGDECPNEDAARAVLETALEREVDPLRYCATTLGVGDNRIMERAARWAGMAYYEKIPIGLHHQIAPSQLEMLSEVRVITLPVLDTRITFSSPDFFGLLRLKAALATNPQLARRHCLVPERSLRRYLVHTASKGMLVNARQGLARTWPYATAHLELTRYARSSFVLGICLLVAMALLAPYVGQIVLLPVVLALVVAPALLRLAALVLPVLPEPKHVLPEPADLPVYSLLIPLRDEAHMVPQLVAALGDMNYPADKLDIIFVVEERSAATIRAVEAILESDARISLLPVPDALPRTKPKALNVALPMCRGELVVVYDAEDTPHPDQLWRVAERFRARPDLACVQAQLVIDNGGDRVLTALFAGEYAGLFGVLLPALARWGLPIPLGGTSNHFRVRTLRSLGGWDAYNVTEDADLGIRLARSRLPVEIIDCPTFEEAPLGLVTWLGQRSRWMKGWMQTFIVHNRDPGELAREAGVVPMLAFQIWALGSIVTPFLHTGFIGTVLVRLAIGSSLFDGWISWSTAYGAIMVLGYGTAVAVTVEGLRRRGEMALLLPQLLLPFYWLLMVPATLRAMHELTNRPFHWTKTRHRAIGLHRRKPLLRKAVDGLRAKPSKTRKRWPLPSR